MSGGPRGLEVENKILHAATLSESRTKGNRTKGNRTKGNRTKGNRTKGNQQPPESGELPCLPISGSLLAKIQGQKRPARKNVHSRDEFGQ
jgi:hypothetical protein